jgi:hypothetical protein
MLPPPADAPENPPEDPLETPPKPLELLLLLLGF